MSKGASSVMNVPSALSGQCKMTTISVLEESKRPVSGLILITGLAAINQAFTGMATRIGLISHCVPNGSVQSV